MSRTYHIVCDDCNEHLWVGQGRKVYRGEEMDKFSKFLHDHEGHCLRFLERQDVPMEYREYDDYE
jgi:hypothetical protein